MAIAIEFATAGNLHQAGTYTLIFIGYILLSFFTGYFRKKLRLGILRDGVSELQTALHTHIFALPLETFSVSHTANYISKLTNDVEIVRDSLFNTCLGLYTEILEFAIAVAAMFYLSPVLGTFGHIHGSIPIARAPFSLPKGSLQEERHMPMRKETIW